LSKNKLGHYYSLLRRIEAAHKYNKRKQLKHKTSIQIKIYNGDDYIHGDNLAYILSQISMLE